jgi:hypothetical protein
MLPDTRTACQLLLAYHKAYAASGRKHIMEFAEAMKAETDTLPDDLKPLGELLSKIWIQVLTESFAEGLLLFAERGLQEIARVGQGSQGSTPSVGCPSQQEAAENNWRE